MVLFLSFQETKVKTENVIDFMDTKDDNQADVKVEKKTKKLKKEKKEKKKEKDGSKSKSKKPTPGYEEAVGISTPSKEFQT